MPTVAMIDYCVTRFSMRIAGSVLTKQKPIRREHIIPRLLLANFTDSNGVLWVYGKEKQVRESVPDSECWERDFYEYELNGRSTNNKYEDWLAVVERSACKVLPNLISRQSISLQDAIMWSAFVASLFARTRKVRKQISDVMVRKFKQLLSSPVRTAAPHRIARRGVDEEEMAHGSRSSGQKLSSFRLSCDDCGTPG
jgi:hypothetical protein